MDLKRLAAVLAATVLGGAAFGATGAQAGLLGAGAHARHTARPHSKGVKAFTYHVVYTQIAQEYLGAPPEEEGPFYVCTSTHTWGLEESCGYGGYETIKARGGGPSYTYFHFGSSSLFFLFGYRNTATGWEGGTYWYEGVDIGTFSTTRQ